MKPKYLLCFFLIFYPFVAFSQYEALLHKPYAEKIGAYSKLYLQLIALKDSEAIARKTADIKAFAQKNNDRELEMEMDLFTVYYHIEFKKHRNAKNISDLQLLMTVSENEGILHVKIRAIRVLADYYWFELKNYELAFEQYLLMEKELDRVSAKDYPELPRDMSKIGEAYYFFQDYAKAIKYFKKAINVPEDEFNTMFINSARNTLGLCYQKVKKYDLSNYYFNKIVKTRFARPQRDWIHLAKGNIGANYYYLGEYSKAIPLLEHDFKKSSALNDYGPVAGAATLLADIFLSKGDMKQSWFYISTARNNIANADQPDRLQHLYPIMSKWYGANGNENLARLYLDSTINSIKAYQEKFNALKVLRAQQKISLKDAALSRAEFDLEKQKKINERNFLIVIVIGLAILIVLGYFVQKKKQQTIEIAKLKIEAELKNAQSEIDLFIYKINEQTKIAERFNNELKKLKSSESEDGRLFENTVEELRLTKILTDDDWINFQKHFAKIFPLFSSHIKSNFPTITEAELRYLMLSKLQLSHKEMAQALGISPDAVRVTWNRVRKKLGGSLDDTPQSLLNSMEV
ncbi:MAG: helix-turn-helix transcriptional regulator [Pedobacter sp.]|uniref:tetratricopeptide repeat protein n=1 Tax=Pedobacter sp. TaxID=1411316 RepID=UPI002807A499|nr:helix-turn-helix transcriptional regulator [Pedobacter sp.]MDQ8005244.1 helix-turn-helix transcriptional regulator [Pedobacter sp.]